MVSKEYSEKLKAESAIKSDASVGITFSYTDLEPQDDGTSTEVTNEYILIKEGTVIGRTYTDMELLEERDGEYGTYDEYVEAQKAAISDDVEIDTDQPAQLDGEEAEDSDEFKINPVPLVGNYLRIIMQETNGDIVEDVEDYMKIDELGTASQTDNFSIIGTVLSRDEWVEAAYAYTSNGHAGDGTFNNKDNLGEFYDICVEKGVNPEVAFVRAIQESSLSASNGNYWGLGTPNGATETATYGDWQTTLKAYCDTLIGYQDPANGMYKKIMQRYEERKNCTENGGIDPNGFGEPSTLSGIQSIYSWLGDDHSADSSGAGGMYYLHPWHHGLTEYEGENKIIFESQAEFEQLCGSKHGTTGGTTSSTPTTVWEQGMYTAWQTKKVINVAKDIFGERAGTYAAR